MFNLTSFLKKNNSWLSCFVLEVQGLPLFSPLFLQMYVQQFQNDEDTRVAILSILAAGVVICLPFVLNHSYKSLAYMLKTDSGSSLHCYMRRLFIFPVLLAAYLINL